MLKIGYLGSGIAVQSMFEQLLYFTVRSMYNKKFSIYELCFPVFTFIFSIMKKILNLTSSNIAY